MACSNGWKCKFRNIALLKPQDFYGFEGAYLGFNGNPFGFIAKDKIYFDSENTSTLQDFYEGTTLAFEESAVGKP